MKDDILRFSIKCIAESRSVSTPLLKEKLIYYFATEEEAVEEARKLVEKYRVQVSVSKVIKHFVYKVVEEELENMDGQVQKKDLRPPASFTKNFTII